MNDKYRRTTMLLALMLTAGLISTSQACGQNASVSLQSMGNDVKADSRWSFQSYGSVTLGTDDAGDMYLAHTGVGYQFLDDVAIQIEAVMGYAQPNNQDDGAAYGFDVRFRWDYWRSHDRILSTFIDAGAGMLWTEYAVPAGGTHQNFTPQVGFGVDWQVNESMDLIAGVRWHHISNAGKKGEAQNPGYDGVMIFAGVAVRF